MDTTNPKELIGASKVPLGLLPSAAKIYGALAMRDGAVKYGPFNWRDTKVQMMTYLDAIERHLLAVRDGEDTASDSGIDHLGHIIAGCAIILDARECGQLIDNRPKAGPAARLLEKFKEVKQ